MKDFDVVIIGGGMVGAVLACALAGQDLRIAVIEAEAAPPLPANGDFDVRVSAVTRASQRILAAVGAWPAIENQRFCPFRDMHVWDAGGHGEIHFDSAEVGEDTLGYIIENRVILNALAQQLERSANIERIAPAQPQTLKMQEDAVQVELTSGETLTARLLVGADGARSWVREQCGIAVTRTEYHQHAVVATIKTELSHQDTAWQRFLPSGPLAFLPLPDGYCSIVWSTTPDHADALLAMHEAAFCAALTEAFAARLGKVLAAGEGASFPLGAQHAERYVQPRVALIGDAAHTIHPLAGQGVNLGFADSAVLAETIGAALRKRQDIGSLKVLRRYERWRKGENLLMLQTMTGFQKLFGSELAAVQQVRNLGLNLVQRMTPLKNVLIRRAMGLEGDLPALARKS